MSLLVSSHSLTPPTLSLSPSTAPPSTAVVEVAARALTVASGGGCSSPETPSVPCVKPRSRLVPSSSDTTKASEEIERQREELRTEFPALYREYPSLISKEADYTIFPTLDRLASKREAAAASGGAGSTREGGKETPGIPKVLNYIWLGGQLPKVNRENIATNARIMNEAGGMTVLWTDQEEIGRDQERFFLDNHILVINVKDVFGNRDSMELFTHFRSSLSKIPPNYGEASDLLRYEILDRFGGYYFDCDVPPSNPEKSRNYLLEDMLKHPLDPWFQVVIGADFADEGESKVFIPTCNDCLGAVPGSAFLKKLKQAIHRRYASKISCDLLDGWGYLVGSTLYRSGPLVLQWTCKEMINDYRKEHPKKASVAATSLMKKYGVTESYCGQNDGSWICSPTNPKKMNFCDEGEKRLKIKHDLIVSLISDDLCLDLDQYLFYLNEDMPYEDKIQYMRNLIDEIMRERPHLFTQVNTIFIRDVGLYLELQGKIEALCGKKIEWKESAALLFAAKTKANDLALYLIDRKGLDFFKRYAKENTYRYDCGGYESPSPVEEAFVAKNAALIQILYERNPDPVTSYGRAIIEQYNTKVGSVASARSRGREVSSDTEANLAYYKLLAEFYNEFLLLRR